MCLVYKFSQVASSKMGNSVTAHKAITKQLRLQVMTMTPWRRNGTGDPKQAIMAPSSLIFSQGVEAGLALRSARCKFTKWRII